MVSFQREVHTVNGNKIVMYTAGKGQPLLFLHGASTFAVSSWPANGRRTSASCCPIARGFGESDDNSTMLDIHDYVMHYVDLLDALGIEKSEIWSGFRSVAVSRRGLPRNIATA